ncbi:MAG: hypothetical protein ACRDKV_09210 [Solirubrobacterales bacterium]
MKEIAARLGVSPGSVHLWTVDIQIAPEHSARNRRVGAKLRGENWKELNRQRRLAYQREGRSRARQGDALHEAGCMLYWAEGSKKRNTVAFSNSDLHMVCFFKRFLTQCFEFKPASLTLRLNVYTGNGLSVRAIEDYWLRALKLPRTCLRGHTLNHMPTSSSGRKKNRLPYGVCTLRLNDTGIVQHIYGAIQEYAGFEEPRWLDGPPRKPREKAT